MQIAPQDSLHRRGYSQAGDLLPERAVQVVPHSINLRVPVC